MRIKFECPVCGFLMERWITINTDELEGEVDVDCRQCNKTHTFEVDYEVTARPGDLFRSVDL